MTRFKEVLFPDLRDILLENQAKLNQIFLVGGAVRDALLGVKNYDLDFVVASGAREAAKLIANHFGGDCYVMDELRNTCRAIIRKEGKKINIDFSIMRGASIEEDLKSRDFTINALAINVSDPDVIIDPLHGMTDLDNRDLKPCAASSFLNDPVRCLRAVRFIQSYNLKYDQTVSDMIFKASNLIFSVSVERLRDELFNIFEKTNIRTSLQLMREFGNFSVIFPELLELQNLSATKPHVHDGLQHSLRVVELIQLIYDFLVKEKAIIDDGNMQSLSLELEPLKENLAGNLNSQLNPHRSHVGLMILAGLYHDVGKVESLQGENLNSGKTLDHALRSLTIFEKQCWKFALSNDENTAVKQMIKHHMHECLKSVALTDDYPILVYSFFHDTGFVGVPIILMHLADLIATYEHTLSIERWEIALKSTKRLLDGWFDFHDLYIDPPKIIDGDDLMRELKLMPGKLIGELLESVRRAQVKGLVSQRDQAFELAKKIYNERCVDA